jgi:hypothetical protein
MQESPMSETPLQAQIRRNREAVDRMSDNERKRYERQLKSVVDRSQFYRFSNNVLG